MSKEMNSEYQERDVFELDKSGGYYCRHVRAMTSEHLHSKSGIAAELGHRDMINDRLNEENAALREALRLEESECDALRSEVDRLCEIINELGDGDEQQAD